GDEDGAVAGRERRIEMLITHALRAIAAAPDRIGTIENEQIREERAEVGEGVVHGRVKLARRRAREHALQVGPHPAPLSGEGAPYPARHNTRDGKAHPPWQHGRRGPRQSVVGEAIEPVRIPPRLDDRSPSGPVWRHGWSSEERRVVHAEGPDQTRLRVVDARGEEAAVGAIES